MKSIFKYYYKYNNVAKSYNTEIFNNLLKKNNRNENEYKFKLKKKNKKNFSISFLNKVCLLTGRSRSIISPYSLKRQIFKIHLMNNNIPNMIRNKF